jgi:hypothetical protein
LIKTTRLYWLAVTQRGLVVSRNRQLLG